MFNKFFDSGEHRLIKQCSAVIRTALEANTELRSQIQKGKLDVERMRELERSADACVFKLASIITTGAVAPNVIDDFLVFIRKEDDIVDSIFNLSREMNRYTMRPRLEKKVRTDILEILDLTQLAITELELMLKNDNINRIAKYRTAIEKYEETGDDIKDLLLKYAYRAELNFKEFNHITELGHKADNILDSAKGVADYFMNIMSSLNT
jgi:uncharacterized protein Yka (UPF0111/DUF47 family)